MADFSIPGVSNRYRTDEVINRLVEVERIPLNRMEDSVTSYRNQAQIWRELNHGLSQLRDTARNLFSFQSPFGERRAVSGDERILTASVTREAVEGTLDLLVKSIATSDRFLSRPLDLDYSVPEGRYSFRVGDDEVRFNFRGGRLSSFVQTLNTRGEGIIRAHTVRDTMNSQTLMIESLKTGAGNFLSFHDAAEAFAENTGIIERALSGSQRITPQAAAGAVVQDDVLQLAPGRETSIPLSPAMAVSSSMVLELEVKVTSRRGDIPPAPMPPPGPSLPAAPSASLGDVTVQSSPSRVNPPQWTPPEAPRVVDDFSMMFAGTDRGVVSLPPLQDTQGFVKLTIPLQNYGNEISALHFRNNNTHRDLEVRDIHIYDPTVRGDFAPANAVSTAADAELEFSGIPIRRATNNISDLQPGVTINLQAAGPNQVELRIEPDRERIKDALIQFVGYYNQLVANINILTRNDETIIQELNYLSPEEQDRARERLGVFNGDITLMQMRRTFQNIMMSPYPTSEGENLSLLAQVGISTNSRAGGGGFDASRMRGYLEIDESRLDESLRQNLMAVRELFGNDTTGDLLADTGAAVAIDSYIQPMVQVGGIIPARLSTIDSQISQTNRRIENYNRHLETFERNLRQKYGAMEGALGNLERSSRSIENFNRNNSNNR